MADGNKFKETVESLFQGMDSGCFIKDSCRRCDPYQWNNHSSIGRCLFWYWSRFFLTLKKKDRAGGGIGGKITPSAVIVIQDGKTKLVNIKNQDTITKLLDMVPDVVDRFTSKDEKITEEDVADILDAE